jgi:thioesterase domain-containing protein
MFDLDEYLGRRIPITRAMGIRFAGSDERGFALAAPLAPNLNDKGTAFAGSMATLVTLCGWAYTHTTLIEQGFDAEVVVVNSELRYLSPGRGELLARCPTPASAAREEMLRWLAKRGKARWTLQVELLSGADKVVDYQGLYVVTTPPR